MKRVRKSLYVICTSLLATGIPSRTVTLKQDWMSKKTHKMIVCFLALLLSGMSWITEGAFVFTQTPNETVYFLEGSNATFKWEYSVDDKAAEFDFILWNVITSVSRTLLFEYASGAVTIGSLIPEAYNGRVHKEGQATLVIQDINFNDSEVSFQCALYAKSGAKNESSVKLIVTGRASLDDGLKFGEVGGSVVFICNATGVPEQLFSWSKQHGQIKTVLRDNGQNVTIVSVNGSSILNLSDIAVGNQGHYVCDATANVDQPNSAIGYLQLRVPPSIDYISHNTTVNETDDLTLFCNASGKPEPSVTWSFLGGLVKTKLVANETLFLRPVSRKDTGIYRCTAVNGGGNHSTADVAVAINYKPEIKDRPSGDVLSWIRHKTVVKCEAEGFPVPDITWSRNGLVESSKLFQTRSSTLSFTPQEEGDFGVYTCIARNRLGTAKQTITVQQLETPQAPEIFRVDISMNNLEIHWKVVATNPKYPILGYLVQVRKQHEPNPWMNCTQITIQEDSMKCVMNDLETNVVYSVRISARNVAGYGEFTEKEVSTREAPGETAKQTGFPKSMIKWIIIGVIGLVLIVLVIVVIVLRRRSRTRGSRDIQYNERKVTVTSFDNPTLELTEAIDSLRRNQNPED